MHLDIQAPPLVPNTVGLVGKRSDVKKSPGSVDAAMLGATGLGVTRPRCG